VPCYVQVTPDDADAGAVGDADNGARGFGVGTAPLHARPALTQAASPRHGKTGHLALGVGAGAPLIGSPANSRTAAASPTPRGAAAAAAATASSRVAGATAVIVAGVQQMAVTTEQQGDDDDAAARDAIVLDGSRNDTNPDAGFSRFKHAIPQGRLLAGAVRRASAHVAESRNAARDAAAHVNACKASIDELAAALDARQQQQGGSSSGSDGVLDEQHYLLQQQLRAAKARCFALHVTWLGQ
jgi:hypothetical protein